MERVAYYENYVILLTGCVNPGNMSYTSLKNTAIRLEQYKDAIRFYLSRTEVKVVFTENTNFPISYFNEFNDNKNFEYLTFNGNSYDTSLGKGYGEMNIIEYSLNHSKFITPSSILIKITGRLVIPDISIFLDDFSKNHHFKVIMCESNITTSIAESRIFIGPYLFYKEILIPLKEELNDSKGIIFEKVLAKAILLFVKKYKGEHVFFKKAVKIIGISGTSGEPYRNKNVLGKVKRMIKYICFKIYNMF